MCVYEKRCFIRNVCSSLPHPNLCQPWLVDGNEKIKQFHFPWQFLCMHEKITCANMRSTLNRLQCNGACQTLILQTRSTRTWQTLMLWMTSFLMNPQTGLKSTCFQWKRYQKVLFLDDPCTLGWPTQSNEFCLFREKHREICSLWLHIKSPGEVN